MDTPYSVVILEEAASTQELAEERISPHRPAVVIAHRQTGGRGRGGSVWETAPRAVAVSIGMHPGWEPSRWPLIPLVAAVAARRALGPGVMLKWPNDLLANGGKVGGILSEAKGDTVVVGLGLNLFWPDPIEGAAALYEHDPGLDRGPALAIRWAEELLGLLAPSPDEWPRGEYREACVTLGQEVMWQPGGRGTAVDIAGDGSLEVATGDGGRRTLSAGSIRHVRPT